MGGGEGGRQNLLNLMERPLLILYTNCRYIFHLPLTRDPPSFERIGANWQLFCVQSAVFHPKSTQEKEEDDQEHQKGWFSKTARWIAPKKVENPHNNWNNSGFQKGFYLSSYSKSWFCWVGWTTEVWSSRFPAQWLLLLRHGWGKTWKIVHFFPLRWTSTRGHHNSGCSSKKQWMLLWEKSSFFLVFSSNSSGTKMQQDKSALRLFVWWNKKKYEDENRVWKMHFLSLWDDQRRLGRTW